MDRKPIRRVFPVCCPSADRNEKIAEAMSTTTERKTSAARLRRKPGPPTTAGTDSTARLAPALRWVQAPEWPTAVQGIGLVGPALEKAVGDELVEGLLGVRALAGLNDAALHEAGIVEQGASGHPRLAGLEVVADLGLDDLDASLPASLPAVQGIGQAIPRLFDRLPQHASIPP